MSDEELLTPREAEDLLGKSRNYLYYHRKTGQPPHPIDVTARVGTGRRKTWRYRKSEILALKAELDEKREFLEQERQRQEGEANGSLLTAEQVAERLGKTRQAIDLQRQRGICPIPAIRFKTRGERDMFRFRTSDLNAYLEGRYRDITPLTEEEAREQARRRKFHHEFLAAQREKRQQANA